MKHHITSLRSYRFRYRYRFRTKFLICITAVAAVLFSCRKEPIMPERLDFKAVEEKVTATTATYKATYNYSDNLENIDFLVYTDAERTHLAAQATVQASSDNENCLRVTGITPQTTYYYQFRVSNQAYEAFLEKGTFTTTVQGIPYVETKTITSVTNSSAVVEGEVVDDDGSEVTARGVCWSTSTNPTISNSHTTNGTGSGTFSCSITGLSPNTTYYVRAYATNSAGTAYGSQVTFSTSDQVITVNGYTFRMKPVEGGTFSMGAQSTNPSGVNYDSEADSDESPVHSVTLSGFYIGETEVTQGLWKAVMGSNPSYFEGDNLPVEEVSWNDCQEFVRKLNQLTGKNFRLPTEAEWEYAARGGSKSQGYKYSGSNTLGNVAWYIDNSGSTTHPVGTKSSNELGIYDMNGNVWEWCQDWYGNYTTTPQTNPQGSNSGTYRVFRGGSWGNFGGRCRVSDRDYYYPSYICKYLGLRLVLSE